MELPLASRALPRLLAWTLVACGGRYVSDGAGGAPADPGSTGRGGGSDPAGEGGVTATGGMSTGMAGKGMPVGGSVAAAGTAPASGGSIAVGGSASVGGAVSVGGFVSMGGSQGTGGSNPGMPASDYERCGLYCVAMARYCPKQEPADCHALCLLDLTLARGTDCATKKRDDLDCITSELNSAQVCALGSTGKFCGAPDALPVTCSASGCSSVTVGDANGCSVTLDCSPHEAQLRCTETGAAPLCSCYIDGKKAADLAIGVNSAKAACLDAGANVLCVQQLR